MITNSFNKLPDGYQGIVYVLFGAIALLYALGIIQKGITLLIVTLALFSITLGCQKLGLFRLFAKREHR